MLDNNINPNFRTNSKDYSKVEIAKINSNELRGNLFNEFRDYSFQNISWESEQIAKSHGIYLEFNRARTGNEKDWIYMLRISIPGGGPITSQQWDILDRIADTYTIGPSDAYPNNARPSLRITTRQNIQLHWVRKKNLVDVIEQIAKSRFFTINGCGDNTRNVIGCPLSFCSKVFNANKWAQKIGKYFALPTAAYIEVFEIDPNYLRKAGLLDRETGVTRFDYGTNQLNRKFKIAFSAIHFDVEKKKYVPDNCVELRTNDIGIAPIVNGNYNGKVDRFQVYVGGSQGQLSGKSTFSTLGEPFGIFTEDNLLEGLDAIVRVHKEWGDRENRHWARLKYLVKSKGIEWLRGQVKDVVGSYSNTRIDFELPMQDYDYGNRNLHLGWIKQNTDEVDDSSNNNTKWCYGTFIENGRITDGSPNGNLKSMIKYLMDKYPHALIFTTPNQHLLFSNLGSNEKEQFKNDMRIFGYGLRKITLDATNNSNYNGSTSSSRSKVVQQRPYSKLRTLSGACVGRDTCRLTYTDSEKFEPYLLDQLEDKWGDLNESIGVTGCEKQCYRPATKTVGWIGTGFNLYQLTIMGTEDGRHQGGPLIDPDTKEQYLHFVPRKDIASVTDTLFEFFIKNSLKEGEEEKRPGGMGYFLRRIGAKEIIYYLKSNPKTKDLMKKTFKVQ
jgi:sulfite reductase beta subunit-like hemoprotein